MERNIMSELLAWRNMKADRMPLVLYGVRQVGKTYILREFGDRYFKNTIYVNFERMQGITDFFEGELQPERIIRMLEEYFSQKIIPDETLLIFDEIQACERALTSLKYFCEEAPEYHVVAAGSLLGVAINCEKFSFPVGKVIMKTLYPMRFDEFLRAVGKEYLVSMIREHFDTMQEMPHATHLELLEWYRRYLYIGGMPAAINQYMERESMINVPEVQNMILNSYTADMAKYTSDSESTKIRNAFLSMPAQLAKENKKFQYKLIRKGATAGLFGDSIAWLIFSGVVISCERTSRGDMPLAAFRDVSAFKLYLSDVGLLSAFSGVTMENIVRNELSEIYRGALAENYMAQTLKAGGYDLYYWTSDLPTAEVDFLIQKEGRVIPIEVKSGENVSAKSLKHFNKMYQPEKVMRFSEKNFGINDNVYTVPLYAAFCV
ncbi:MAG: ATP-binding protein [Thermoflexaceae bacterium]|nr:ATP-binding protein [Thermoflexaceae bacterium]